MYIKLPPITIYRPVVFTVARSTQSRFFQTDKTAEEYIWRQSKRSVDKVFSI